MITVFFLSEADELTWNNLINISPEREDMCRMIGNVNNVHYRSTVKLVKKKTEH